MSRRFSQFCTSSPSAATAGREFATWIAQRGHDRRFVFGFSGRLWTQREKMRTGNYFGINNRACVPSTFIRKGREYRMRIPAFYTVSGRY